MNQEDYNEISFQEIVDKIKNSFFYLLSKWFVIVPLVLIAAIIGYLIALYEPAKYNAKLSFVLSTESKSGNLGGLASQFGIDLGGSSGNDVFSGDNIMTLFRSKKMISRVLFKKPTDSSDLLINVLVRELDLDKKWKRIKRLEGSIPFTSFTNRTPTQDSLINEVYLKIDKDILTITRPDKKLSLYEVNTTSTNEIFCTYMTKYLVDETSKFYIDTKTSIAKLNLRMLQREADSLRSLLGSSISTTASEVDRTFNLNPALQVQRSSIQRGQLNTTVLGSAYGEVVKNLEIAKINLQKETPLYEIIDSPTIPLKAIKPIKLFYAFISGFIVFLIICIILLVRRKIS